VSPAELLTLDLIGVDSRMTVGCGIALVCVDFEMRCVGVVIAGSRKVQEGKTKCY
jgi:hypothetical protein